MASGTILITFLTAKCAKCEVPHTTDDFASAEAKGSSEVSQAAAEPPRQNASSKIGPVAHRLMEEHNLSPDDINPTGPQGIILKGDVLEAIASRGQKQQPAPQKQSLSESKSHPQPKGVGESKSKDPPPAEAKQHSDSQLQASKAGPAKASQPPSGGKAGSRKGKGPRYTDIPNSQIRKIIAQRLLESRQQIPSMYVTASADVDAVAALRQSLKEQGKKVDTFTLPGNSHNVSAAHEHGDGEAN